MDHPPFTTPWRLPSKWVPEIGLPLASGVGRGFMTKYWHLGGNTPGAGCWGGGKVRYLNKHDRKIPEKIGSEFER